MNNLVTIFRGFHNPISDKPLDDIVADIKGGAYKQEVERVRQAVWRGQLKQADQLKKQLLAFTPSGQFQNGRRMELLVAYSGYIILDLDDLDEQLKPTFVKATLEPCTYCCFQSPSGKGLKIIVKVASPKEQHEQAYSLIADHYEKILGVPIDRSGKDITRLCFVSDDPYTYLNANAIEFPVIITESFPSVLPNVQPEQESIIHSPTIANTNVGQLFQKCIDFTNAKETYAEGNRNNYIHLLACHANRAGITQDETEELINQSFDLDPRETRTIVSGVFRRHSQQFGQSHDRLLNQSSKNESTKTNFIERDFNGNSDNSNHTDLLNMPGMPEEILNDLPELLLHGIRAFSTPRERDVFLTGAITILSGCLPNVEGIYDQRTVYPNLNSFIIAPAASGKGALVFAKTLGQSYHNKLLKESQEAMKRYEAELQLHKANQRKSKKDDLLEEPPQRPTFKILFIPGNSSSAAVIRHLIEGDEKGIFCETEADTMSNSLKQDWGGYSDLLRKAFQHESISYSRKTNQEYLEINKPKLSVALSGTPAQVQGLIKSAEDGLFSRFLFYTFKVKPEWRDVSPRSSGNLTQHFAMLSNRTLQMVEFLDRYPTGFDLTREKSSEHNSTCSKWLKEITVFVGEEASSSVKRLGLIAFRMAMVLSAIRKFENGDTSNRIVCDDSDFGVAFRMAEVYLQHSIYMFSRLPRQETISDPSLRRWFDALPKEFAREQAVSCGQPLGISPRTVDKYLSQLSASELLTKPRYGCYTKN